MYPFLHLDLPTGDFFYRNRVARRLPSRSAGFIYQVSTRALRAQKIPKISKHFFLKIPKFSTTKIRKIQKIAKMLQIPPSEREPGGASLILGLPLYFVLRKEPHMKVSLKSKNVSIFFSKLAFSAEILKTFEDEQRSSRCRIFENRSQILRPKS